MAIDTTGARAYADFVSRRVLALGALETITPQSAGEAAIKALIAAILQEIATHAVVTGTTTAVQPGSGTAPTTGTIA
jgi:hypothetical protein